MERGLQTPTRQPTTSYRSSPASQKPVVSRRPPQRVNTLLYIGLLFLLVAVIGGVWYYQFYLPSILDYDEPTGTKNRGEPTKIRSTIKLDENFDSWDEEKKKTFLKELAELVGQGVEVLDVRRGSVILDVKLDPEQARKLEDPEVLEKLRAKVLETTPIESEHNEEEMGEQTITLYSGDHVDVDFGLYALATLSGLVFHDVDADGVYTQPTDQPMPGVVVRLVNSNGVVTAVRHSDRNGRFTFVGKEPGEYYVSVVPPKDYHFSPQPTVAGNRIVTNVSPSSGNTSVFVLTSGKKANDVNAGLYGLASIEGYVREDKDADGQFSVSYDPVPALTDTPITLSLASIESKQVKLAVVNPDKTTGKFTFAGIQPGTYIVQAQLPSPWRISPQWTGSRERNHHYCDFLSTGETQPIVIRSMQQTTVDLAVFKPCTLKGFVFEDLSANGYVVWPLNETELQRPRYVTGAKISLKDAHSREVASDVTGSGLFSFENLLPGRYTLRAQPPSRYKISPLPHKEDLDKLHSIKSSHRIVSNIMDPNTHETPEILLQSGDVYEYATIGMYTLAIVEGVVWDDINANGKLDENEPGLPNILVVLEKATGGIAAQTKTDENGRYVFEVSPGNYKAPRILKPEDYHSSVNAKVRWRYGPAPEDATPDVKF